MNTKPLVWGMEHGPQRSLVELAFATPAVCAAQIADGSVQIGLAPVAEIARQNLEVVPGLGIACLGAVRSILLFSKTPWNKVRTLAADASSRTSVELARVILRERYGVTPLIQPAAPDLPAMMREADAALVIGDPALQIDPRETAYEWLDLGEEWFELTKLPMVFALWAGKPKLPVDELRELTQASYEFGKAHLDEIVAQEARARGITEELAEDYLRRYIRYEIGANERRGLEAFFELARLKVAQGARA